MMKNKLTVYLAGCCLLLVFNLLVSCQPGQPQFSEAGDSIVKDSVTLMAANIEKGVSAEGPVAWLDYFEDSPQFFMANNGQLAFEDYKAAKKFVTTQEIISQVRLSWHNLRVDALSDSLASIAADFHEDITDVGGRTKPYDGYFTGTAHRTSQGWRLRNAHWSQKTAGE